MATPVSSLTAYASYADLALAHDVRKIGQLVADKNKELPESALAVHPVITFVLKRASGEVEQACFVGGRYSAADLGALAGVGLEALKGLVCDLAFWHLTKRRYREVAPEDCPGAKEALDALQMLRDGVRVFPLEEQIEAANAETPVVTEQDLQKRRPLSVAADRYFGVRNSRERW
jgi:hypothetical protein